MCNSGPWRIRRNMKAREISRWRTAGAADNSPAFERWVGRQKVASPEGTVEVQSHTPSFSRPFGTMRIRFADISQMLRVADPRSGARLCEAQHVQSIRMPIYRIGMVESVVSG